MSRLLSFLKIISWSLKTAWAKFLELAFVNVLSELRRTKREDIRVSQARTRKSRWRTRSRHCIALRVSDGKQNEGECWQTNPQWRASGTGKEERIGQRVADNYARSRYPQLRGNITAEIGDSSTTQLLFECKEKKRPFARRERKMFCSNGVIRTRRRHIKHHWTKLSRNCYNNIDSLFIHI